MMNIKTLSRVIKKRRKELSVDQATVAELAGVSVHTLSDIESGKANPSLAVINQVLDVLGLELDVRPKRIEIGDEAGE